MATHQRPELRITRVKAGFQPLDAQDFKAPLVQRAFGVGILTGVAVISAAGDLGTAAGRISSIVSPMHWD